MPLPPQEYNQRTTWSRKDWDQHLASTPEGKAALRRDHEERRLRGVPGGNFANLVTNSMNEFKEMRPVKPEYASLLDDQGNLLNKYKIEQGENLFPFTQQLAANELTTLPYMQQFAKDPNRSAWANLMIGRQGLEELTARDSTRQRGDQAAATAWSNLAMRGGLSGGERERIGYQSAADTSSGLANVARAGQLDRYGIDIQDQANKMDILKMLPGLELNKAELLGRAKERDVRRANFVSDTNVGSLIEDTRGKNMFDLGTYGENMRAWAAEQQAKAQAQANRDDSVLCTELYRQGLLPLEIYLADSEYGKRFIPMETIKNYHAWAKPLVKLMEKSSLVTLILRPFITAWAYEMAHLMGVSGGKSSLLGRFMTTTGVKISNFVGKIVRKHTLNPAIA